jgi:hypothetical protein
VFSLGSNSRVRGKAAADLGWSPTRRSVTQWIAEELSFRERSGASPAGLAHLKLPTAGKPEFE